MPSVRDDVWPNGDRDRDHASGHGGAQPGLTAFIAVLLVRARAHLCSSFLVILNSIKHSHIRNCGAIPPRSYCGPSSFAANLLIFLSPGVQTSTPRGATSFQFRDEASDQTFIILLLLVCIIAYSRASSWQVAMRGVPCCWPAALPRSS